MVARYAGDGQWLALDADAKPTNAAVGDRLITDSDLIYRYSGSVWLPIHAKGAYNQIVFKEGSTYYATNINGKVLNSSTTNPGAVIQTCLDLQGKTFMAAGDYTLGASFTGVNIGLNFTSLDMDRHAKLIVPNGYTGYIIKVKRGASNSGQLRGCRVSGGELNEASGVSGSHLWTGVIWEGGPLANQGTYASSMRDMFIEYAATGVKIDCTLGWINGNTFDSITVSGCTTGFDFVYPSPTDPANAPSRDTFINCIVQHYAASPTTTGFKNIGYKSHVFINCNVWDQDTPATQKAATISGQAKNIIIDGGILARLSSFGVYFTDNSKSTVILQDEWHAPTYGGMPLTQNIFAPNSRKIGRVDFVHADIGNGILAGPMTAYSAEAGNTLSLNATFGSSGRARTTASVLNAGAGSRCPDGVTMRSFSPVFKCMFKLNTTTSIRPYFGWSSGSADITGDDPLNALHGVMLTMRAVDTNFQIAHNNGSGATVFIDTGIAKNTDVNIFELICNENATNKFKWALYSRADLLSVTSTTPAYTDLVSSDIPGAGLVLRPYFQITNGDGVAKSFVQFQLYVESD